MSVKPNYRCHVTKTIFLVFMYFMILFADPSLFACFVAVIHVFEASTGKPLGDGEPIDHKVYFLIYFATYSSLRLPLPLAPV